MQPKLWAPLSDAYKPPALLFRNIQLQQMLELSAKPLPSNMHLQGDPGLGKTLTTRFFRDEIEASGMGACFHIEVEHKISDTLKNLKARYHFDIPDYTLSAPTITAEILKETDKKKLVCLIVDEPKKAHSLRDVDSMLFSFYQAFLGHRKLSIIMVSQMIHSSLRHHFSRDTLSRLRLKPILFPSYDVPEIVKILKQRLTYMLDESQYDVEGLYALATHIRRIGSDIREALELLRCAVEEADTRITKEVMHNAIEWGKQRWWKSELESLPPHYAYLLYLTATSNHSEATQLDVMHQYLFDISQFHADPLGRRTIYYAFNKLAQKGYFEKKEDGLGRNRTTCLLMDEGDREHIVQAGKEIDWSLNLQGAIQPKEKETTTQQKLA
jgi:Cdc6-like AAA superfamily ATPase